jgi:sulfofructose kinase
LLQARAVSSNAMTIDLVCLGHASVDHHFGIDAFPTRPTKTPASRYRRLVGGMAANAAVAATRLGASVRLVGRVGDDESGALVCSELAALGVAELALEPVHGTHTSVSTVIVDAQGERQIFNHRGSALAHAHALDVAQLEGAQALLTDPRWPDGAAAALAWAREHDVLAMLDADVAPAADLQRLVPLAPWVVFSENGLHAYAPGVPADTALRAAVASGAGVAMVTLGERGVRWTHGDEVWAMPAFAVTATDTTGAGDVFHAALALQLGQGEGERDAIRWASAAAAIKCERPDGILGTPTAAEVTSFLMKSA